MCTGCLFCFGVAFWCGGFVCGGLCVCCVVLCCCVALLCCFMYLVVCWCRTAWFSCCAGYACVSVDSVVHCCCVFGCVDVGVVYCVVVVVM